MTPTILRKQKKFNSLTKPDSYPISRIGENMDSLGEASNCSALDTNCGYWKIDTDEPDGDETIGTPHDRLYCFHSIPFGLKHKPKSSKKRFVQHYAQQNGVLGLYS